MARRTATLPKVPRDWLFSEFERRGLNRCDVAEELHQSRAYFNNWETSGLNAHVVAGLKEKYNIDVLGFLAGPEEPEQMGMFSKEEEILLAILNELHTVRKMMEGKHDSE